MLHFIFLTLVSVTVVICCVFGVLMLFLSIPQTEAVHKYRIFRKLLAFAYLIMAGANIAGFFVDPMVASSFIICYITLIISSFQSFLFTCALIALINIDFFTKRRVIKELVPIAILTLFCSIGLIIKLPPSILDAIFYIGTTYYVFQLLHYTVLFNREFRLYQKKVNDFFSEKKALELRWVHFSFYLALSVGIIALTSVFVTSLVILSFFIVIYAFFFLYFGIKYLNYIYVFNLIEPVTHAELESNDEKARLSSDEIAQAIERWVQNKGFIESGITLVDLAAHLNTNRTYLSNYINQEKEMNFNAWINWLRIEESKNLLLENPQIPIVKISEQLGYSEQSNFGRNFLKFTSTTPSQWRHKRSL